MEVGLFELIFAAISFSIGLYWQKYLGKKAQLLAANENFETITKQLADTTELTKNIEARITNSAWVEQQRWEIRKEFYVEARKVLYDLGDYHALRLDTEFSMQAAFSDDLEKYKKLEEENDHLLKMIMELDNKLRDIFNSIGLLFLNEKSIEAINIYLEAEKRRCEPLEEELKHTSDAQEAQYLNMQRNNWMDYIDNQRVECLNALEAITQLAREDLKLADLSQS